MVDYAAADPPYKIDIVLNLMASPGLFGNSYEDALCSITQRIINIIPMLSMEQH
jgi:hypothetical protein